jgi:hypothetical protein
LPRNGIHSGVKMMKVEEWRRWCVKGKGVCGGRDIRQNNRQVGTTSGFWLLNPIISTGGATSTGVQHGLLTVAMPFDAYYCKDRGAGALSIVMLAAAESTTKPLTSRTVTQPNSRSRRFRRVVYLFTSPDSH